MSETKTVYLAVEVPEGHEVSRVIVKKYHPGIMKHAGGRGAWIERHINARIIDGAEPVLFGYEYPDGTTVDAQYPEEAEARASWSNLIDDGHGRIVPLFKSPQLDIERDNLRQRVNEADKITAALADANRLLDLTQREILELKQKTFARFNNDECWIYQGDGNDHLESLVCPVVISAAQLMGVLQHTTELEKLTVWFGSMPESNGKKNWTAILHSGDITDGFTIARSEYKDRVRYDADCVLFLLGEREARPDILDYDGNLVESEPLSEFQEGLCKFYGVDNLTDLIKAQNNHVERLQVKLGVTPDNYPRTPREG